MTPTRRTLFQNALFGGAGWLGLRALATGIPLSFLRQPAQAQTASACDKIKAQYLILSTSGAGDPLNANVPGTYDHDGIAHAADPSMAPTTIKLGTVSVKGAQIWSTLPASVLDRTSFFHHSTLTNNHPNHPKVLSLMGGIAKSEMLPSLFSQHLAQCFSSVQREPIALGTRNLLTSEGRALGSVRPTGLRDLLAKDTSVLGSLQTLRDKHLDEMNALLKESGTAAQRKFLDEVAQSRGQARKLGGDLMDLLGQIKSDNYLGQVIAATAVVRMNISPVVTISIPFGGDNHTDADLMRSEVPQHITGVAAISDLMARLTALGLADTVTFAAANVFGRTLKKKGTAGRDHWGSHHATVMIGKNIKPGVIGGLELKGQDYIATSIDSMTGAAAPGNVGDIKIDNTLGAVGKTLGAGLGIDPKILDANIARGKVVRSALTLTV